MRPTVQLPVDLHDRSDRGVCAFAFPALAKGGGGWRDEKLVLHRSRVHPSFVESFPPLRRGGQGGWSAAEHWPGTRFRGGWTRRGHAPKVRVRRFGRRYWLRTVHPP